MACLTLLQRAKESHNYRNNRVTSVTRFFGLGDKEVINITLVSAADILQSTERDRLSKGEKREGISCSFSLASTVSRKWSEKNSVRRRKVRNKSHYDEKHSKCE